MDVLGDRGALAPRRGERARHGHVRRTPYMWSLGVLIAGGTANIQRNIIAERGLGLPRDVEHAITPHRTQRSRAAYGFRTLARTRSCSRTRSAAFSTRSARRRASGASWRGDGGHDAELWRGLAELGVARPHRAGAITAAPELELLDLALAAEELG